MLTNITLLKTMLWVEVTDICRSYDIRYLPGEKVRYIIKHEVKVIIYLFPKKYSAQSLVWKYIYYSIIFDY